MRAKLLILTAFCVLAIVAAGILAADAPFGVVIKEPFEAHQAKGGGGKSGSTLIAYHGGLVMTGAPVNAYVIYYGAVDDSTQGIVNQFYSDLSNAPEYAVNQTYTDKSGASIAPNFYFNPIAYGPGSPTGSLYEDSDASQGSSLGSNTIPAIVQHAIQTGGLPADQNGVYFVITAPDIKVAGFCKSFCAYHTSSTSIAANLHIRYALVPDPGQACTGCDGNFSLNQTITPSGNRGADEMTDSIMHELSESVTDPDIGAWYTSGGAENGDLCNYVYGSNLPTVPKGYPGAGAYYNFSPAHGRYYLVQQIWTNIAPQACLAAPR